MPKIGTPIAYTSAGDSAACLTPITDVRGVSFQGRYLAPTSAMDVVSPDGRKLATVAYQNSLLFQSLLPQPSALIEVKAGEGNVDLLLVSEDGGQSIFDPLGRNTITQAVAASDPAAGAVAWLYGRVSWDSMNGLWSFDERGTIRWHITESAAESIYLPALAVDCNGETLELWDEYSPMAIKGRWVTPAGVPGEHFELLNATELADLGFESRPPPLIVTRNLEGGLFIGIDDFGADPSQTPRWIGSLDSLATHMSLPPEWLKKRSGMVLHPIHHGTAYAAIRYTRSGSVPRSLPSCTESIELLSKGGESCGTLHLSFPQLDNCRLQPPNIGPDGTLLQAYPAEAEHCDQPGACTCSARWWPALLR